MKKVLIVLAMAALMSVSLAATAQAGKVLSGKKANAVTQNVALKDCRKKAGCQLYGSANCRRQAITRISCLAVIEGTASGANFQCTRLVIVKLKRKTQTVAWATGNQDCYNI